MIFLNTALAASPRYRQTEEPPTPSYEPETITARDTYGIPDDAKLQETDKTIKYYKNQGVWANIGTFHPMLGTTAAQRGVNFKNPGTHDLVFNGSWIFSAAGNKGNGTNTYAISGFVPRDIGSYGGASIAVLDNTPGAGVEYGKSSPLWYMSSDFSGNARFMVGSFNTANQTANSNRVGIYTGNLDGSRLKLFKDGVVIINNASSVQVNNTSNYYGAYDLGIYYSPRMLGSLIEYGGTIDPLIIYEGQRMLEVGLGRK